MAYVYLICSLVYETTWVYVGSTENVERRLKQHNLGQVRSTKGRLPYKLIYVEELDNILLAIKREKEIKSNRILKEELIRKFL